MKKITIIAILLCIQINSYPSIASESFSANEVTYVVEMSAKKPADQIDQFSQYYQQLVEKNEPGTLAWQFFRGGDDKIYLIERYENSEAANQHISNISPGGLSEEEFGRFTEHFVIEKIQVHGAASDDLKAALEAAGFNLEFRIPISGYSRK